MNKSITQVTQNDKQISKSIKGFFTRFHVSWIRFSTILSSRIVSDAIVPLDSKDHAKP